MCGFQLVLTVDSSLGRVDYTLLSDQTLMEMFLDGFDDETKKQYQDKHGMYLDVCEWSGTKCDDDGRVVKMEIDSGATSGSLELCYLPAKMKKLDMSSFLKSKLTGTVDLTHLPEGIKYIALYRNQLTGEVELTKLPDKMKSLYLHNNRFTGEINLSHLPDGMECLYLGKNQLRGEIDFRQLSKSMRELSLDNNQLTGEVDLTHLSDGMLGLKLEHNQFSGSLILKKLPHDIRKIDVRENNFNHVAVVESKAHALIMLKESGVTSVVDENGREQDMKRFLR